MLWPHHLSFNGRGEYRSPTLSHLLKIESHLVRCIENSRDIFLAQSPKSKITCSAMNSFILPNFRSQGSALSQKQMLGSDPDSPYVQFPPSFCLGRMINKSCPVPAGLSAVVYKINPLVSFCNTSRSTKEVFLSSDLGGQEGPVLSNVSQWINTKWQLLSDKIFPVG